MQPDGRTTKARNTAVDLSWDLAGGGSALGGRVEPGVDDFHLLGDVLKFRVEFLNFFFLERARLLRIKRAASDITDAANEIIMNPVVPIAVWRRRAAAYTSYFGSWTGEGILHESPRLLVRHSGSPENRLFAELCDDEFTAARPIWKVGPAADLKSCDCLI